MAITGVGSGYGNYVYESVYGSQKNVTRAHEGTKVAALTQQAEGARNPVADRAATYDSYLKDKYDCVRNGSVAISGAYLKECAKNPQKAKELEENLSYFKEGYENGLRGARANARAIGARLVNYSETWSIDSTGNITMMASTTVTSDSAVKGWKEQAKEREKRLEEKREQELEDFLSKIPELEKQGYEQLCAHNKALGGTVTYYQQTWTINQDGSIQSTVYSVTETEMTNAERLKKNIDERLEKQKERKEVKEKAEEREEQDSKLHGEPQRPPVIEGAEQKAMVGHMQEESELAARERMQKEKMGGIYHPKIDINI